MNEIENRINLITSALTPFIFEDDLNGIEIIIPEQHTDNYERLKNVLIMLRQHEFYAQCLTRSLSKTKADIDYSLKSFKDKLCSIHETVQFRTAIPTEKIFVSNRTNFEKI